MTQNLKKMYSYIWIEGENNLYDFCLKRFGDTPCFLEHFGKVSGNGSCAKVEKREAETADGGYRLMFLLTMEHEQGRYTSGDIDNIRRWDYEQIRTDKTAILRRRG